MPEMSGDQMACIIKQARPETPVVLLTGFGALIEVTGEQPEGRGCGPLQAGLARSAAANNRNLLHAA